VAAAIARGKVTLADFTSSKIKDPVVLNLARRVTCQVKEVPPGSNPGEVELGVKVKDGRVLYEKVDIPYGNPKNPMSREELVDKFRDCAKYSVKPLGEFDVDAIIEFISHLEHQTDLSKLLKYIS
jgi:2-methylcitrate dehydratase PrpD